MKNFTKILSMVLLIAMCMSMLTVSAFAENGKCPTCGLDISTTQVAAVEATCSSVGHPAYYPCSGKDNGCTNLFWDKEGTLMTAEEYNIPVADHSFITYEKVEPTCKDEGSWGYNYCTECEKMFSLKDGRELSAEDLVIKPDTSKHVWGNWGVTKQPTTTEEGEQVRICTVCKEAETEVIPVLEEEAVAFTVAQTSGGTCYEYAKNTTYSYVTSKEVEEVYANGASVEFASNSDGTKLYIESKEFSGMEVPSIELKFVSAEGEVFEGLSISRADKAETGDIVVSGLSTNKYVKGSDTAVSFRTTDSNPDHVKIYSLSTQTDIPAEGNVIYTVYYDKYTYSFSNDFLDSIPCGSYEIRSYFGTSDGKFADVGTLIISDPNTNVDESLYFVNSTQGDDRYFKYVSGDEVPRMYCELFLIDGAKLQVSTNGGKSWSNVNVHNYMIELSNGKDTSHAWIGSDYLNSLSADTYYYFRVLVPASANGTNADWVSNTIRISTGPTLKAVDTAKHVINSSKSLKFVCSDEITKVYVGNVQLTDEDDFYVSKDGKTVTLTAEFLNKRTAGSTYTIKVLTESGEYASTTFQILTTAQASASPRTGDTSNIGLWTAVLMLSAGAGVAILPRLKKD